MGHHRFFDSDSDEEIAVHLPPSAGKTGATAGKEPLSVKWPRVLIRYESITHTPTMFHKGRFIKCKPIRE